MKACNVRPTDIENAFGPNCWIDVEAAEGFVGAGSQRLSLCSDMAVHKFRCDFLERAYCASGLPLFDGVLPVFDGS